MHKHTVDDTELNRKVTKRICVVVFCLETVKPQM